MNIPARLIPSYVAVDAVQVSLRSQSGAPCAPVSIEDLGALIAASLVCGVVRGRRLKYVQLLVPPDVAWRHLGESRRKVKTLLHSEANDTFYRRPIPEAQARIYVHHARRCSGFQPALPELSASVLE